MSLNNYDFKAIEQAQQAKWQADNRYHTDNNDNGKPTRYMLSMFPYPSGKLHMGHVRNYAITDVLSRYYRQKGYDVMQPMGWDAFGLPAENAAIDNEVAPHAWTMSNIEHMRGQLKSLGLSIDWSREFATCNPDYYKWEQWLFLQLYKKGLVYKKLSTVNWDPVDNTVLANEQVIDGRGWRSGAVVEKRDIPMYYFKITDYADELLDDLKLLENKWPKQVLTMQHNWIGKSHGMELDFTYELDGQADKLTVFTTRPDTIMGVSYLAVSAEHPLAQYASRQNEKIAEFCRLCKQGSVAESELAKAEKVGMDTGLFAKHPVTGEDVAIWVANYVLMSYGSGAVMGVPAHDERDFEFAKKYNLPIKQVIELKGKEYSTDAWQDWYSDKNGVCVNSGVLDGMDKDTASAKILEVVGDKANATIQYRLRDWGVSRQRYWGCPIPMINCQYCGTVPVPESDLPVVLPTDVVPDGHGNPLKSLPEFVNCTCPKCGQPAERETDTFDTFVESSWYAQRFTTPHDDTQMVGRQGADKWLSVNQYVGGIEHAILHLLYARFFHKVMRDEGLVGGSEPFECLLAQGMVLAGTFYREKADGSKTYYFPYEVEVRGNEAVLIADGEPVTIGKIEKMSKSKNNGVDPQTIMGEYGADTVRLYTMFTAPADQTLEWSDSALKGPYNFVKKVWRLADEHLTAIGNVEKSALDVANHSLSKSAKALRRKTHETIAKIDTALGEHLALNTPVSSLMELANDIGAFDVADGGDLAVRHEAIITLLTILSLYAPHVGEHLLEVFGFDSRTLTFPTLDKSALVSDSIVMAVQVNGKVRGEIDVPTGTDNGTIKQMALSHESVAKFITGEPKKVIVVPNKLVSVVV
ncbi:leucine--tRNA ligase [Moraxella bovis]|uniref:Leucine--tRNA ligase n=1 Tax=Moraxella bovis TaxID=476 RepID=A0AAQ2Q284_MORBO|nr:leucine--tRNA ligase [Moraxella bovis]AWY20902.1 leucine--tRNA ligase [Moraxella bovis]UYZ69138.1 leucine--tRNA ligase [Moraxella bovis]UYZ71511.1 leucine--tRNA ligase [Moraxella bovis]UYZ72575.1 leucine--tRNA ligase [Moraxella bovis]UYZ76436.1 leucine--tRNA ligase [Moraxella bovis]